ncbi:glutathione S-transferase [Marinobacter hydrocarbonoclasticus]|nr:glutathione S-transferase [Marinobacter nauticus]
MKLYYSDASPYARVVRMLWRALEVTGMEEEAINPFSQDRALRSANPLGKLPCLICEEGALYDSSVILRYLDEHFGQGRFFAPLRGRWALERDNALLQGLLDAAVALRVEETRQQEGSRSAFWSERHGQTLSQGLAQLEPEHWPESGLLSFKLIALLEYLDFRHPHIDWRAGQPQLLQWLTQQNGSLISATRPR